MLARGHVRQLIAELWDTTDVKVQLPASMASGFLEESGPTPAYYDDHRTFLRFRLRTKAVLKHGEEKLGAYLTDVSRKGAGFLSPVQLMPKDVVHLTLATCELHIEVTRCRRVDKDCFECGGKFVS